MRISSISLIFTLSSHHYSSFILNLFRGKLTSGEIFTLLPRKIFSNYLFKLIYYLFIIFSELLFSPPIYNFLTHILLQHFLRLSLLYYSLLDFIYILTLHLSFCHPYTLNANTTAVTTVDHLSAH